PADPEEQRNLADDPLYAAEYRRLDQELTREVIRSVRAGNYEQRVMARSLSHSDEFGQRGWQRPYPGAVEH
ncbi:MAG: hypothetical protein GX657_16775, partial [Chloroflexi bacterium]|nr:hypothetical protein [Chloroflexota bacterium]